MSMPSFAYPAGENAAESEPEQERVWKENRHNAQKSFQPAGAGRITADTMRGSLLQASPYSCAVISANPGKEGKVL